MGTHDLKRSARGETDKAPAFVVRAMTRSITVEGMSCGGCESNVEEALSGVAGVTEATADRETDSASVEGDAAVTDLVAAVEAAGYDASA